MNNKDLKFIDIHCHYDDLSIEYLKSEFKSKNQISLCSSVSFKSYVKLEEIRKMQIYGIYFSYGLYPDVVLDNNIDYIIEQLNKIDFSNAIAIGEIGLDNKITKDITKREEQKRLFEKQLELAEKKKMPVIVHSRYATKNVLEILKNYNTKTILHWFSGSEKEIEEAFNRGYYLTINFDRTKINITEENIKQIFIETDYPIPYNNKTDIFSIKDAYEMIAKKNNQDINYLKEQIQNNFFKLFPNINI